MDNLILSFNVVLPLFLSIMLGYFLRCIRMIEPQVQKALNKLCFKVFLPVYLFNNLYTTNISAAFSPKLLIFSVVGVVVLFAALMLIVPRIEKTNPRRGVMIQAMFRSNFALFGLPVALSLCGQENMGPTSLLVGVVVPVFNVLAVITLETFRGGKPDPVKMLRGIATNPLIIASLLGIAANLIGLKLPSAVEKGISSIGGIATPLSLVALGAAFTFGSIRGYAPQLIIAVASKLVINPLVMVTAAALLGLRNEMLVPVLIMFGAPTAVSSYPMAQQMDGDGDLAASLVVFTSALSILTIFLWVFVLKEMALI